MGVYKQLIEGGAFTMPFLLHIYDNQTDLFLINDNEDLTYNNTVYMAAGFDYEPSANGEATLEIDIKNKSLLNMIHKSRKFCCDLIGIYNSSEVEELSTYKHKYGDATWDGEKFQIKLNADDRGNMTFPALIYNSYNNRGA